MFNRVGNDENNLHGNIFSSKLRFKVQTFESDLGTLSSPSERKAISECLPHPAALAGSDKKRSMANLAEFTVNDKVVWEPRENIVFTFLKIATILDRIK